MITINTSNQNITSNNIYDFGNFTYVPCNNNISTAYGQLVSQTFQINTNGNCLYFNKDTSNLFNGKKNLQYNLNDFQLVHSLIENMSSMYRGCSLITGTPKVGDRTYDMSYAYYGCTGLTGAPKVSYNTKNMSYAYYGCTGLKGYSYTDNITNSMTNKTSSAIIYNRISAVCGPLVTNFAYTYYGCSNIDGYAACGDSVTNMSHTYAECNRLIGFPAIGKNVINMDNAYTNCYKLYGPPNAGNLTTILSNAYRNCYKLSGSMMLNYNKTSSINAENCFFGHNNQYMINIFVPIKSPFDKAFYSQTTNGRLFGSDIKIDWTDMEDLGYYNTLYNIYIYNNLSALKLKTATLIEGNFNTGMENLVLNSLWQ